MAKLNLVSNTSPLLYLGRLGQTRLFTARNRVVESIRVDGDGVSESLLRKGLQRPKRPSSLDVAGQPRTILLPDFVMMELFPVFQ